MDDEAAVRDRVRLLAVVPEDAGDVFRRVIAALERSYDLEVRAPARPRAAARRLPILTRAYLAWDRWRCDPATSRGPTSRDSAPNAAPSGCETGIATAGFALALSFADRDSARRLARDTERGCIHVESIANPDGPALEAVSVGDTALESRIALILPDGKERTIATHRSRVHPLSVVRTRDAHRAKLDRAIVRAVEAGLGETAPRRPFGDAEPGPSAPERPTRHPRSSRAGGGGATLIARLLARRIGGTVHDRLRYRHWRIGLLDGADALERLVEGGEPPNARLLVPPPDRFWADPFPVVHEDGHVVFFEEWVYRKRKAHISCIHIDDRGRAGPVLRVLERPFHLSYPFVFRWRGAWHMLPEATSSGTLTLYRAVAFPHEWEPVGSVFPAASDLGTRIADATLHRGDHGWWLFGVVQGGRDEGRDEDLHVFRADSPIGPWTPHPRNPVVTDPSAARPAGRLFRLGGRLLRPAQDCSGRYGRRISVREVRRLDPEVYEEAPAATIDPTWAPGLSRTHTLSSCPGLVALDGSRDRFGLRPPH